jgi:chemotaxis protein methyltransferase CheR
MHNLKSRSAASPITGVSLSEREFTLFQEMIFRVAGITMSPAKKALVAGRLAKRVKHYGLTSFERYFRFITAAENKAELQIAVDLLTTNETYFFRERKHFDFLRNVLAERKSDIKPFRVWSAASSSGEEAYSIAMLLDDCLGSSPWEVVASDISTRVLEKARSGIYSMARTDDIPQTYLKRYCLKGDGQNEGLLMVAPDLRSRVSFLQVNLNANLPNIGEFDVIFLRNVMIYFSQDTKREVVERLYPRLRQGGYFMIGHSESLNGINNSLSVMQPSIYCRR